MEDHLKGILIFSSIVCLIGLASALPQNQNRPRIREFGITIGILEPGPKNAITDVLGVKVGHVTLIKNRNIRTGVTAVLPHDGNLCLSKVPAAVYVANGYGKLMGYTQIEELGNLETPIILTNTLSVPTAANALIGYILALDGNENIQSVNPVVGETNDGYLNDIRGRHVTEQDVLQAIKNASSGPVQEGSVGSGTGTTCFRYKGGIGTASRVLAGDRGGYTIGVLVQTNFGGNLQIRGVPVGRELPGGFGTVPSSESGPLPEGSCMMVVATDAPLDSRNLKRLAKRTLLGIPRTGGFYSNGSGDYCIAFSTAPSLRIPAQSNSRTQVREVLRNSAMSALFLAAAEASEEAILNSMFRAETMTGRDGHRVGALPLDKVRALMKQPVIHD
jgi:D-aminopeptidase